MPRFRNLAAHEIRQKSSAMDLVTDADEAAERLIAKGLRQIFPHAVVIGEEATETVMAAKDGDRQKIVYEIADLWFHSMIALSHFGLAPRDVLAELERREGLSGLEEFALRKLQDRETKEG